MDSREALRALLEAFGYDVIEAVNGREAVAQAVAEHPAIVLMDMMMPEMDGFDAIRSIRACEETRALYIIAVTAMHGARDLALQAGANDYVRKPVDIRKLVGKLNAALEQQRE